MGYNKAEEANKRRVFIRRLLTAWDKLPSLRFGQFIKNVAGVNQQDPFYISDSDLIELAEKYAEQWGRKPKEKKL